MEITNNIIDVEVIDRIDASASSQVEVVVENPTHSVQVNKKEYVIVGDELYIPKRYEDAPQWLRDLIDTVTNDTFNQKITEINSLSQTLNQLIVELDVAKNTYTQSIISSNEINERINTAVTTLNSSLLGNDATILSVATTKTTPEEASSLAVNVLSASINDTESGTSIGSIVGEINNAIATGDYTNAQSIEAVSSVMQGAIEASSNAIDTLSTFVGIDPDSYVPNGTGLLYKVELLEKQVDGVIETVTGTHDVMQGNNEDTYDLVETAEPYASWISTEVSGGESVRASHVGDTYIKYELEPDGSRTYLAAYKFIKTVVDITAPFGTDDKGYTWAIVTDTDTQNAYLAALKAYDLADEKRRVFVSNPYVPYDNGDLWLVQIGASIIGTTQGGRIIQAGDILKCIETKPTTGSYENNDWVPADNYRESMNAIQSDLNTWRTGTYATFVSNIQSQVDSKSETFYQAAVPTGRLTQVNVSSNTTLDKYVGDLWKNTYVGTISSYLGNNTEYVYTKTANGSNWNYGWTKMEVPDIVFDTIDTKKSIYSGNSVPVAVYPDVIEVNDMWITGSSPVSGYDKESIYVYSGSSWIKPLKYTDDTSVIALSTGLANGTATIKLSNAYVGTTPLTQYINSEIDGKVGVYSGTTSPVAGQPSGVALNDIYLWFTTESKVLANGSTQIYDVVRTYKYNGTVWNEVTTNSSLVDLADLADGKRTIFGGNIIPVGAVVNDIWIPSANNGVYLAKEIYVYNGSSWNIGTKYSADIASLSSNIQNQIDGKVDTYYQSSIPYTNQVNVQKDTKAGDYWYCTLTSGSYTKGKIYKYTESINGANFNYTWTENADITKYAFDLADSKASIYRSDARPATYKKNDMIINIAGSLIGSYADGVVLTATVDRTTGGFTASDWSKLVNDTEDLDLFVSSVYNPNYSALQNQIDKKIEYWFNISTNDPKAAWTTPELKAEHNGDVWYQTDTKNSYYYNSTTNTWNAITNKDALDAIALANTAQATADGKITVYYAIEQSTAPSTSSLWYRTADSKLLKYASGWVVVSPLVVGDLLYTNNGTEDNRPYRYNGSSWVSARDGKILATAEALTQLNTEVLDPTTGALVTAVNAVDQELRTVISDGDIEVQSKWEYNSNVLLDGEVYSTGFGLATNVSHPNSGINEGTSEFWINAEKFKFTNSAVSGQVAPFTIDATGVTPKITFNGEVSFSNVAGANMSGSNLLYNSAPTIGIETKGWQADYNDTGIASSGILAAGDPYRPTGAGAFHQYIPGTPPVNTIFNMRAVSKIPVIGGQFYEGSAYLNSHRCDSRIFVGWMDSAGALITYSVGDIVTQTNTTNVLSTWGRSKFITQAPDNATSCYFYIRGITTGQTNPFVFVSMCYFGRAAAGQTVYSNWSEGISASASSSEVVNAINGGQTTTINGGRITTGSITANQIAAEAIAGKTITGGTISGAIINGVQINGAIIKSSFIDLSSTLTLTNWKFYTPSNVPPAYVNNFAKNNDGTLVVDSEGYVRLPGQTNFIVGQIMKSEVLWEGNLSNITIYPSKALNLIYDIHSWNSYNVSTLQRSIRQNTQFATGSNLVFSGKVVCDDFDNTGTDTVNYAIFTYRVLDTEIEVWAQASNGNDHNSEIARINFNGATVAYGDGRYGEQSGADCASLDFNSNIKGLPINIKVKFNGGASIDFISTVSISSNSIITNHTIDDLFILRNVNFSLNTSNTSGVGYTSCSYSVNYASVWVS